MGDRLGRPPPVVIDTGSPTSTPCNTHGTQRGIPDAQLPGDGSQSPWEAVKMPTTAHRRHRLPISVRGATTQTTSQ